MNPIDQLTPTQHAVLAYALEHTDGKIEWFPEKINGGVRKKVLDGLFNRALITPSGTDWFVAGEGYDAMGRTRPAPASETASETETEQEIAPEPTAEPAPLDPDPEIEAAVSVAEAEWVEEKHAAKAKPRTRENSKQAEIIRMLQRAEGATIAQICETTGWQAHTVRGTFAGAFKKKLGLTIVSDKAQGGERVYRIA